MTSMAGELCRGLRPVVRDSWVAEDGLSAGFRAHTLRAESRRECTGLLANLLYETLHSGFLTHDGPQLKRLRHARTDAALAAVIPHMTTRYPTRLVRSEEHHLVVWIDGVRVWVPRPEGQAAQEGRDGDEVALQLPAARPALSPGFFLVDGSRGRPARQPLLRLYAHLRDLDDAVGAWRAVLIALEDAEVGYRAKVLSAPQLYPRQDALVLYLGHEGRHTVPSLVSTLMKTARGDAEVSPFVLGLAPGIGVAWEPDDRRPGHAGLSFGQHRASALAEGLMEGRRATTDALRTECVAASFLAAGIDPREPWRNTGSPELRYRAGEL